MDPWAVLIIVAVVLLLAAGGYFFVRWRQQQQPRQEPVFYHRCPHCKQKLKYRADQAGRNVKCKRCKNNLVFPVVEKP